jgi:glutathione-independent formaldehyde dehydrogenase
MSQNRVVVYQGAGKVGVEDIDYPRLQIPDDVVTGIGLPRKASHAAIIKLVATNICGSDQHMVRGRTTAPIGQSLGHEITGEVVEVGDDVLFVQPGDICSAPFNIACGRCRMCNEGKTGVCLNVNPARPGAAYGYVDMGGWIGGQAEYVMVPFADVNLLKFPDREQAWRRFLTSPCSRTSSLPAYHGAYTAGVTTGSTVYVAGAGPVGLAAAHAAQLLGASAVIVGVRGSTFSTRTA